MKTPKQKRYIPPTTKQLSDDMHRYSGKSLAWSPDDEGPYDRVMGKDMMVEKKDVLPKRKTQKIARGGKVAANRTLK